MSTTETQSTETVDTVRGVIGSKRDSADIGWTCLLSETVGTEYRTLATNARRIHGTGGPRQIAREDTGYASL
jgi:hypothetical protein